MKHLRTVFVFAGFAALCGLPASASTVYSQNFDTGSAALGLASGSYWGPTANSNGYICVTTADVNCAGGAFAGELIADQSGTGFFLFEGTGGSYPTPPDTLFFDTGSITVTPFTNYAITFFLTNANSLITGETDASVQVAVNNVLIGSPVMATGFYSDGITADKWQQFTFTFDSNANTTVHLGFNDLDQTTVGNDFGIDGIAVNSIAGGAPEPGTFVLFGAGALAGLAWFRRKAAAGKSSV
jgi:hypothetical protein